MKIEIIKNDFGYSYRFYLKNADGSASSIDTDSTVKLRARHSENEDVVVEKELEISNAAGGVVLYTLQASDFSRDGVYYGEIEVSLDAESKTTYQGFTIVVLPKV